jgi:type IV secretory pathway VirB10-like protein
VPSAYEPPSPRTAAPARRKQAAFVAVALLAMSSAAALALREGASSAPAPVAASADDDAGDAPATELAQAVPRPEKPDAGPPKPPPPPPPSVAEAQRQIAAGNKDEAYRTLVAVRRETPKNARANLMLGHLQFERLYFTDGLDSYDAAIGAASELRTNATLLDNVMRAFANDRTRPGAESLILRRIGRAALTRLDKAAKADKSKAVRTRAAIVAKKLRQRR